MKRYDDVKIVSNKKSGENFAAFLLLSLSFSLTMRKERKELKQMKIGVSLSPKGEGMMRE